jgi:hypothetical protein
MEDLLIEFGAGMFVDIDKEQVSVLPLHSVLYILIILITLTSLRQ